MSHIALHTDRTEQLFFAKTEPQVSGLIIAGSGCSAGSAAVHGIVEFDGTAAKIHMHENSVERGSVLWILECIAENSLQVYFREE